MKYQSLDEFPLVSISPGAASRLANGRAAGRVEIPTRTAERSTLAVGEFDGDVDPANCAALRRWMEWARTDPNIDQAVLRMRSPGGFCEGTAETFEYGMRLRGEKSFVVLAEGFLCSAAYYIASSATTIYASPSCLVGSCGTVQVLTDVSEMFASMGIRVIPISTGVAKNDGRTGTPITEEVVARVQRRIQQISVQFRKDIKRAGRMTAQQREDAFETAEVYLADEAVKRGYIDSAKIPEDFFAESDARIRRTSFVHLFGDEAEAKFESLVCKAAGVSEAWEADDEHVDAIRAKYPVLAKRRDEHVSAMKFSSSFQTPCFTPFRKKTK